MGRDMGDDHPKQDTQLVDLLRRILGNLDVGDSIGSRKRDEERYVLEYQRIRHELRLLFSPTGPASRTKALTRGVNGTCETGTWRASGNR